MNTLMLGFMNVMNLMKGHAITNRLGADEDVTLGDGTIKKYSKIGELFSLVCRKILGPVLAVIGVAAVIYAIILGVNYAKAEDADARKKVQGRLIGALIGAAIIIVGATLCFALKWEDIFENFTGDSVTLG